MRPEFRWATTTYSGQHTYYYYDHENRLVHVDNYSLSDVWFRYDALGRRVVEKVGSSESLFYYDGFHIIEETDASLGLNRLSLFGIKLDEVLYSGDTDGSGNLTAHRWPMENHLGSIILVVDDSAILKTSYDYWAHGAVSASGGSESYPYRFTGRRFVDLVGALDLRTRFYDPRLGRFLQRDSIGIWGDRTNYGNGYTYVGNEPINTHDKWGKVACSGMEYDDEVIVEEGPESLDPIEAMAGGWDAAKTQADTECDDWCGGIGLWCPSGGYGCEGDVTMASSRDDLDELMEGRLEDGQLYGFRHLGYWDPDQGGYMDTRYYILEKTYQYNCKCKCVWSLGLFLAEMIGGAIDAIGSAGAGRAG